MRYASLAVVVCVILFLFALSGCPSSSPPPPAAAFEACGEKAIKVSGFVGNQTFTDKAGKIDESSDSVKWSTPDNTTDAGNTGIDDASASGGTAFNTTTKERTFTATGTNSGFTIEAEGTINEDCTGSGTWKVLTDSGSEVGSGTWSID